MTLSYNQKLYIIIKESLLIALTVSLMFALVNKLVMPYIPSITSSGHFESVFISSLFVHLFLGYSGINTWYVQQYCQLF